MIFGYTKAHSTVIKFSRGRFFYSNSLLSQTALARIDLQQLAFINLITFTYLAHITLDLEHCAQAQYLLCMVKLKSCDRLYKG